MFTLVQASERGRVFLDRLERTSGTDRYFNSGVYRTGHQINDGLSGVTGVRRGAGAYEFLGPMNEDYVDSEIIMPEQCVNTRPHVHPRGEVAITEDGEWYDADMKGNPLVGLDGNSLVYPKGSVVYYARLSVHRPMSRTGTKIRFCAFGGLKEFRIASPPEIRETLRGIQTPENAAEYIVGFLCEGDVKRKQRILDGLFDQEDDS